MHPLGVALEAPEDMTKESHRNGDLGNNHRVLSLGFCVSGPQRLEQGRVRGSQNLLRRFQQLSLNLRLQGLDEPLLCQVRHDVCDVNLRRLSIRGTSSSGAFPARWRPVARQRGDAQGDRVQRVLVGEPVEVPAAPGLAVQELHDLNPLEGNGKMDVPGCLNASCEHKELGQVRQGDAHPLQRGAHGEEGKDGQGAGGVVQKVGRAEGRQG
mmetsp:Transcript_24313/g.67604  ORF Transcript_24313/g.67604 Transcript_24313/m.67604 type:complete len:211 (+) Transcript_24313:787-1419(+)